MIIRLAIEIYDKGLDLQYDKLFMIFPGDQLFEGKY